MHKQFIYLIYKKLAVAFCCLVLPLATFSQSVPSQHYRIYNTITGRIITVNDIANDMGRADVLFFGEEHNDTIAHNLEFQILDKLINNYPAHTALSMEMFETDTQLMIDEYLSGLIREKNFKTDTRAWPNYIDYRPLVELAKQKNIHLIAANAPARYTNMVTRMGLGSLSKLSEAAKAYLPPLPIDTATGKYYQNFAQIMGGHASMPGMELYQSQNLWDATMGWSIARYLNAHKGAKVFQVNGGFHSQEKLGAVAQLKKYDRDARVLTIASVSGADLNNPDWNKYLQLADYVIITDFKAPE